MFRGDCQQLPAVRVAAIDFVKTAWRIAGSTDDGSAGENIVDERSGLGAVKQAGARFNFQSNSHGPLSFIDGERDQTETIRNAGQTNDYKKVGLFLVSMVEVKKMLKKVGATKDEFKLLLRILAEKKITFCCMT